MYVFQMYFDADDGEPVPAIKHEVSPNYSEAWAHKFAQSVFRRYADRQRPYRGWFFRRIDQ